MFVGGSVGSGAGTGSSGRTALVGIVVFEEFIRLNKKWKECVRGENGPAKGWVKWTDAKEEGILIPKAVGNYLQQRFVTHHNTKVTLANHVSARAMYSYLRSDYSSFNVSVGSSFNLKVYRLGIAKRFFKASSSIILSFTASTASKPQVQSK